MVQGRQHFYGRELSCHLVQAIGAGRPPISNDYGFLLLCELCGHSVENNRTICAALNGAVTQDPAESDLRTLAVRALHHRRVLNRAGLSRPKHLLL